MKTIQTFLAAIILSALSLTASAQCNASFYADTSNGGMKFSAQQPWFASYHWTFGDGDTSDAVSPFHAYASTGSYTVCLIGVDSGGICRDTECQTITVAPCQTAANTITLAYSYTSSHNTVTFTNTSSSPNPPLNFVWSFYQGTPSSSTLTNPVVNYPGAGTYNASFYASDALGCAAYSPGISVTVAGNLPCHANITPDNLSVGTYSFTDSFALTGYNCQWSFGDGSTSTDVIPTHTYATNGNYTVCLIVSSTSAGCADTTCTQLNVQVCETFATFADTLMGMEGNYVKYVSTATTLNPPLTYLWNFSNPYEPSSTLANPQFQLSDSGSQDVTLIVTDANGCVDSTTVYVPYGPFSSAMSLYTGINIGDCGSTVYLILQDTDGHLVLADSITSPVAQGVCSDSGAVFSVTVPGTYFLKGALLPANTSYSSYLPTYYPSQLSWATAAGIYISLNEYPSYLGDITMQQGVNPGGPGFISGWVSEGAGLTSSNPASSNPTGDAKSLGAPIAGVQIDLTTEAGQAVAYTFTDANGHYQFSNLAYGTYVLFTDVLNSNPSPLTVTLSGASPSDTAANDSVQQSALTGVAAINTYSLDQVYPDPVVTSFILAITSASNTEVNLKLVDVLGRAEIQKQITLNAGHNYFTVDMSDMASGVYELELENSAQKLSYKLVKAR